MAATIRIGWRDQVTPIDTDITAADVIRGDAVTRAAKHLAVERGGKRALAAKHELARLLARLAARLPDGYLSLHAPAWDQTDGLSIGIWYVRASGPYSTCQIQWSITLCAPGIGRGQRILWQVEGDGILWRRAARMDVLVREVARAVERQRAERQAKAEEAAAQYAAGLPPAAAAIQAQCRATCLQVSADGSTVCEALHDVGGAMTFRLDQAHVDLSERQVAHDRIYHPERLASC